MSERIFIIKMAINFKLKEIKELEKEQTKLQEWNKRIVDELYKL